MAHFTGTSGDDDFTGTTKKDTFDMSQGGNDHVFGQGGKDLFYFGAAFTADDSIDGGALTHHGKVKILGTVELNGDYSAGVVFGASTMVNIAHLVLDAGHSYNFTFNETTIGDGHALSVDALALGVSDTLVIDNSADTDGDLTVKTNAGHVNLTGGSNGQNTFVLGATLDASDHINGGAGSVGTLVLKGDYGHLTLDTSWIQNITHLQLGTGHYDFTTTDAFVGGGLSLNGGTGANLVFDGSAETSGLFLFSDFTGTLKGGGGNDEFDHIAGTAQGNDGNDKFSFVTGTADGGNGDDTFLVVQGTISGGAGNDIYTQSTGTFDAGTGNDKFTDCGGTFHLEQTGQITFLSDGSQDPKTDDTLYLGASLTSADHIQTGVGNDTVVLDGDYHQHMNLGNLQGVDVLKLTGGNDYNFVLDSHQFSRGSGHMTVDGTDLGAGDSLTFSGGAARVGKVALMGGAGNDTLTGTGRADTLSGGGGNDTLNGYSGIGDTLNGGGGADHLIHGDTFIYAGASDSTGLAYDTVDTFDVANDHFQMSIKVTGVDQAFSGGTLDNDQGNAMFNQELAGAVDAAHLQAHHAVVFTATGGNLAGDVFLVVDQNGIAGYQGGEDLVILLDGGNQIANMNINNFQ